MPGASLFAHTDFLQRQTKRVQALSDAVVMALRWLQTAGLTDVLKSVPESHWIGDRAVYLGAFQGLRESYAVDGLVKAEEVAHAWQVYARLLGSAARRPLNTDRTFTNVFAQNAQELKVRL